MNDKLKEAIEYWTSNLHAYCESGSPRDHLAINDIGIFLDTIKSITTDLARMSEALESIISIPLPQSAGYLPIEMKKIAEEALKSTGEK